MTSLDRQPLRFGVIGDPIRHSLSPRMHNAAYAKLGLPYLYLPFRVPSRNLRFFVRHLSRIGLAGVNVTVPHKRSVIDSLDSLEKEAAAIGAVNTILIKEGRRIGYNTDGRGFLLSLKEELEFHPQGKRTLIVGAGGAARAVAFALAKQRTRQLTIVNRTLRHAEELADDLIHVTPSLPCQVFGLQNRAWYKEMPDIDLVVQTTSMGLISPFHLPIDFNTLPTTAIVCDLIYHPGGTPFLKRAARSGRRTLGGLGMLLQQGGLAFQLFTGRRPPLACMREALAQAQQHERRSGRHTAR